MTRRLPGFLLLLPFLPAAVVAGCGTDSLRYEYRDDASLAGMAEGGREEVLRNVNSPKPDRRMLALRLASGRVDVLRRRGNERAARELEEIVIRRYFAERNEEVRAGIVRICAPAAGRSAAMVRFLRERIAAGEFPGYAALSLAAMAPRSAYADVEPLTRHPDAGVRLHAATALTVLGDPRGFNSVRRVWRSMEEGLWPAEAAGETREEARTALAARARRAFGRELR